MRRASYRMAIRWIAANDADGDTERLDPESVRGYVSSLLVADLFDVDPARVGADVVRARRRADKGAA